MVTVKLILILKVQHSTFITILVKFRVPVAGTPIHIVYVRVSYIILYLMFITYNKLLLFDSNIMWLKIIVHNSIL